MERQLEMLLRIGEAEVFLSSQVWETSVPQVQERKELVIKELETDEVRKDAWQFVTTRVKRTHWCSSQLETDEDRKA